MFQHNYDDRPCFRCGSLPTEEHQNHECLAEEHDSIARSVDEIVEDESLTWAADGEAMQFPREKW